LAANPVSSCRSGRSLSSSPANAGSCTGHATGSTRRSGWPV
jgi:hypothetical protein